MDVTLVNSPATEPVGTFVRSLYESSFPAEERRCWTSLAALIKSGKGPELCLICTDNDLVGFMTVWKLGGGHVTYIEHFAISPSYRGSGIGGMALDALVEASESVILEVEPAVTGDDASRRIKFYRRHGFFLHEDIDYIQPPYSPDKPSVRLAIMTAGGEIPDMQHLLTELKHRVYGYTMHE